MSGNVIDETRAGVDVMLDVDDTAIQLLHGILDGDAGAVLPRDKSMSESEKQSFIEPICNYTEKHRSIYIQ